MTEDEWLSCVDQVKMLDHLETLQREGKLQVSDRKLRLFACACCRRIWDYLNDECRRVIEAAERLADTRVYESVLAAIKDGGFPDSLPERAAYETAWHPGNGYRGAKKVGSAAAAVVVANARSVTAWGVERKQQASLLRDVLSPFRPVTFDPSWLRWNDGTVPKIAQAIYDERRFQDMPILADALEDAGCDNEDILRHCREPGLHVRGCWVIDLILGKE